MNLFEIKLVQKENLPFSSRFRKFKFGSAVLKILAFIYALVLITIFFLFPSRNCKSQSQFISNKWCQKGTFGPARTGRTCHDPHRKSIRSSQRTSRCKCSNLIVTSIHYMRLQFEKSKRESG